MSEIKLKVNPDLLLVIGLVACVVGLLLYLYSVEVLRYGIFKGWYYETVYPYQDEGVAIGVFGGFLAIIGILLKRQGPKKEAIQRIYCPYCGSENSKSAIYCVSCGKKLEAESPGRGQIALPGVYDQRTVLDVK